MNSTRRQFLDSALGVVGGVISTYSLGIPVGPYVASDVGMGSRMLDLPEAKRLDAIGELVVTNKLQPGAGFARLGRYTKATTEAIEYLSKKGCTVLDLGVHEIDLGFIKIFQSWEGLEYLRFNGLKALSPECARGLCSVEVGLRVGLIELGSVPTAVAGELARNRGWLSVSLPETSWGVIHELSKHQGKTEINLMSKPSYEEAIAIAHHNGLSLDLALPEGEGFSPSLISALSSNPLKKLEIWGDYAFSWIEISDLDFVDQGGRLRRVWLG